MVKVRILPWPRGHKCPFLLRDDDLSFFTEPHTLKTLWSDAWKNGFVVSFSVLPRIACNIESGRHTARLSKTTLMVPPNVRGSDSKMTLTENPRIVRYLLDLMKDGKANLILHGYTHERIDNKPEFAIANRSELENRLEEAQKIFQAAFGRRAAVFVPPWDTISREAWEILSRRHMGICRRFPQFWNEYLQSFFKGYMPLPYRTYFSTIFPWYGKNHASFHGDSYDFRLNGYFTSFLLDPYEYLERAKSVFKTQYKAGHVSFWGNHHWEFFYDWEEKVTYKDHRDCLDSFLKYVHGHNVWKCGVEDLLVWLQRLRHIKVKKTGDSMEISSTAGIQGLTLESRSKCRILGAKEYSEIGDGKYVLDLEPDKKIHVS